MEQLSIFLDEQKDTRQPMSINWNLWHGCTKASAGCMHCYMYRRDESIGKDPSLVVKTDSFDLPVRILRSGKNKGKYKIPAGSHIWTCFSSDFFHKDLEELLDPKVAYMSLYRNKEIITKEDFSLAKKVVITYLKGLNMDEWVKETSDLQELMLRTAAETKR